MKVTRSNVFETNSSSSHSLSISEDEIVEPPFSKATLRKGVVSIKLAEYGWEWRRMFKTESKLSYLLTQILQGVEMPSDSDEDADWLDQLEFSVPQVATLRRIVSEVTGCTLKLLPSSGYIDHDSDGLGLDLFKDEDKLKAWLFNQKSWVQTGNDNDSPQVKIRTDLGGAVEPFASNYSAVPDGFVAVELTFPRTSQSGPTNKRGAVLSLKGKLLAEVYRTGVATKVVWHSSDKYSDHYLTQGFSMGVLANDMWIKGASDTSVKFTPHLDTSIRFIKADPREYIRRMEVTFMVSPSLAKRVEARSPKPKVAPVASSDKGITV